MESELESGLTRCVEAMRLLKERNIEFVLDRQSPDAILLIFSLGTHLVEAEFFDGETLHSRFDRVSETPATPQSLRALLSQFWE